MRLPDVKKFLSRHKRYDCRRKKIAELNSLSERSLQRLSECTVAVEQKCRALQPYLEALEI